MAGSESELSILLPILQIDSQRDKANIMKDIEEMVKKEVEKNINLNTIDIINIVYGITTGTGEGKNAYYRYV
jgi:hypothetical protein